MKKLAIGCGVAALLVAIAGGVGMYWFYTKAKDIIGSFAQMRDVAEMDAQVKNTASFTPPDTGEIGGDQLARFTALNEQVQASLGPRFEQLKARYDQMDARMRQDNRDASAGEALAALKDLAGIVKDVRAAQVKALNDAGMSIQEYRWIRDQAYAAAGIPLAAFNVNAFIEAAKSGDAEQIKQAVQAQADDAFSTNEKNRELVKPLSENLQKWAAVAWLGF